MKDTLKPMFVIDKNAPEVKALLKKYDHYSTDDNLIMTDTDRLCYAIVKKLSVWEQVVWYAYAETGSIRKMAKFFNISFHYSRKTIQELKEHIRSIANKNKDLL